MILKGFLKKSFFRIFMWNSRPPPPTFMEISILNFHFDYLHPSLNSPPKNATTTTPSSDTRDFKQWLETKLSPSPVPSVVARTGIENLLSRASSADSRTLEPQFSKPQGTAQSTPVQPSNHLNTSPPPSSPHSLPSPPHTNAWCSQSCWGWWEQLWRFQSHLGE